MVFDKNTQDFYPEGKDLFAEVDELYANLSNRKEDVVSPFVQLVGNDAITPKIVWKWQTYAQYCLHRVCDLVEGIALAWEHKKPAMAFILNRAIMENTALLYDIVRKLQKHLKDKNFQEIDDLIIGTLFASRLENPRFKATSILTIVNRINKEIPGFQDVYDLLSEITHPNHDGVLGLYGKIDDDGHTCRIGTEIGVTKSSINRSLLALVGHLNLLVIALDLLNDEYKSLAELAMELGK